jgi:hypothetical protein
VHYGLYRHSGLGIDRQHLVGAAAEQRRPGRQGQLTCAGTPVSAWVLITSDALPGREPPFDLMRASRLPP